MKITLDFPPSANRYWRHDHGVTHRSTEANAFCQMAMLLCRTAGMEPLEGDVCVRMSFFRPAKRGDLDNRIKIVLDALQGYAYLDDSQIIEIHAYRKEDKHNPRVEVEIHNYAR